MPAGGVRRRRRSCGVDSRSGGVGFPCLVALPCLAWLGSGLWSTPLPAPSRARRCAEHVLAMPPARSPPGSRQPSRSTCWRTRWALLPTWSEPLSLSARPTSSGHQAAACSLMGTSTSKTGDNPVHPGASRQLEAAVSIGKSDFCHPIVSEAY